MSVCLLPFTNRLQFASSSSIAIGIIFISRSHDEKLLYAILVQQFHPSLSCSGIESKRLNISSKFFHDNHSSFLKIPRRYVIPTGSLTNGSLHGTLKLCYFGR